MKKIGLVGGISWSSTIDYYRIINEETNRIAGGLNFAECLLYSVNFNSFHNCNAAHDWDGSFALLADAAKRLEEAGADMILLCANTAHIVAERVAETVHIPLVDIRVVTANAIHEKKINRIGLLGTTYTMELDFYQKKLRENKIESIVPENKSDRDFIEQTLVHELGKGILLPQTKREYIRIAEGLIERGAEGIVLGCTEIPLLISQDDFRIPVFNTTEIHAKAAVLLSNEISINQHI
ncbi:MAG: aspartate/glutamate racemase family protein [Sediminibacterium sp.]|nr:aspartate/glutamate racemase family protein [Sediminibacterium sp.]